MEVIEVKHTLDGRKQEFTTEGLISTARLAVVRFEFLQERHVSGFVFPEGGFTLGFFWAYRHYLLYRFCQPNGNVIAHRFDIIRRPALRPGRIEYRDLAVDIWVAPDGSAFVEDEDELEVFLAAGKVHPTDAAIVERTRRLLLSEHPRIFNEASARLAGVRVTIA